MARTLDQMVNKGQTKLTQKSGNMASSYNAAKGRMKTGYGELPFGPTRKSNYNAGVDAATYISPDPSKWARNWRAKMSE